MACIHACRLSSFCSVFTFTLPFFSVTFSEPEATPPPPTKKRVKLPEGWTFKRAPIVEQAECSSTSQAPSPPTPPVAHSSPNRHETEYWFKQFLARLDQFVDMLLIHVLPTVQRSMCRNHCSVVLYRLHQAVGFIEESVATLCRVTEFQWWIHTQSFQAIEPLQSPFVCRPWWTLYQQTWIRRICRERLFYLVQVARDLQDQTKSCLCCARHARKFCVDMIKETARLKESLSDSIRASCSLHHY